MAQTLTWNAENRLSTAVVGSTTTTFTYDSFGERLKKVSGSNTSIYPFGDDYEVTNGTITKYISVDGLGLVAKKIGATTYWIQTDRLGSINVETDSGGASTNLRRNYRPFGETLSSAGTLTESRGWIDQRNDTETSLTYLHARYFDPKLGEFLSPDPLSPFERGVGANRYSYVFGNPFNGSDRSGLRQECFTRRQTLSYQYTTPPGNAGYNSGQNSTLPATIGGVGTIQGEFSVYSCVDVPDPFQPNLAGSPFGAVPTGPNSGPGTIGGGDPRYRRPLPRRRHHPLPRLQRLNRKLQIPPAWSSGLASTGLWCTVAL